MQQFRPTKFSLWDTTDYAMPRVYYGGGKSQTSTSQVSIPPEVLAQYQNVNSIANQVAQTPFQQYSTDPNAFVAPLTPTQQAGILGTNQYSNEAQPFYQTAANMNQAAANPVSSSQISNYMNPYMSQVVNPVMAEMEQQFNQAQSSQLGNAIQNGAFGGDRAAVTAANLQNQQALAAGQTLSGLYNQNYAQALGEANTEQQAGFQGATNEANIGSGAQAAGLAGAQAQLTAGQAQQQTEQAGLTALYNQFLQEQSYPFQTTQFLANIAEGTGALSGSTTTSNQPAPYFSDERLKDDIEPIGKTFDGLNIIKFRYKGDKQPQIGLSAQDVEKKHPEAVGLAGGYKTVDYDAATKDAAHKGRDSHSGGLVVPLRDGDVRGRKQYDVGGYAGLSPNSAWAAGFNLDPSYLQAQEAAYGNAPWGNAGPVTGATPYGGKSHVPPSIGGSHAALSVARTPSGQNSSGLQQLSQGIGQVEGLGKAGKSLFNDVKGNIPGLAPSASASPTAVPAAQPQQTQMPPGKAPPSGGSGSPVAPATDASNQVGGLDVGSPSMDFSGGLGDLGDDLGGLFARRGGRIGRDSGGGLDEYEQWKKDYGVPDSPSGGGGGSNDLIKPILDQDTTYSMFARRGGRIGRDGGGPTYSPPTDSSEDDSSAGGDIPYESGTGASGLNIPDDKSNNHLAVAQPPSQSGGGGGGFNPLGLITGALGLFGLASGGRVGLAGGGSPDDMPLPTMDDADSIQQGLAPPDQAAALRAQATPNGPSGHDVTVHARKTAPIVPNVPTPPISEAPKEGLNPDAPAPAAQPVQMVQDMGSGQHLTQPGEVLTQDNPGGVGDFLNRNQGLIVPFLHGLGTMASSNSRYLGSAILQGLGGAADSYENVQNEMQGRVGNQPIIQQRQNEASQTELDLYQSMIAQRPELSGMSFPQFEALKNSGKLNSYLGGGSFGGAGQNRASMSAPGDANGPFAFTPQEMKTRKLSNGLFAYQDPAYMSGYAAHNNGTGSRYVQGTVNQANRVVGETAGTGFTTNAAGERQPVPGFASNAVAQSEPQQVAAEANQYRNSALPFRENYGNSMSLLNEMDHIYQGWQSGPTAEWRGQAEKFIQDLDPNGTILGHTTAGEDNDKIMKDIGQLTARQMATMSQGAPKDAHELVNTFSAEPTRSPGALRDLIIRSKAYLNQMNDYYSGYDPYHDPRSVFKYQGDFFSQNPFEKYRTALEKTTPAYAGQNPQKTPAQTTGGPPVINNPADARKLPSGTVFMTPDGRRLVAP